MATSNRVLFVAGEVTPFAEASSIATLARTLPEQLQESSDYEARVMMPCYGGINERKHSLHEVIRLSGTDVPMGDSTETLTVKVASVPGVRLQVYFMDHASYFEDDDLSATPAESYEDVVRQALFFNRAALETIRKLRWDPDLVHAFGWMSGLIPLLLSSDYAEAEYLAPSKSIFTPDDMDPGTAITPELATGLDFSLNDSGPSSFSEIGAQHADASISPPGHPAPNGGPQFDAERAHHGEQLASFYDQMLNEVPA
ncbi:MAG: glycogen/starch synthase [Salinibacter sp.]